MWNGAWLFGWWGISKAYERGIQSVHRSWARRAKKGPVKPWRATWRFILIFSFNFFSTQFLNFEKSFSLSPGPQSSLVPHCKISFEGPGDICVSWLRGLAINCAGLLWKQEGKFYFRIFPQMFYLTEFKIVFVYLLIKHNCLSGSILLEIIWTNNLLWVKIRIPFG